MPVAESLQRDHFLARPGRHGLRIVFVALDGFRLAYVKILVPQRQAIRTIEAGDQLFALAGFIAIAFVQRYRVDHAVRTVRGIAEQQFAARPHRHVARALESLRVDANRKAVRYVQLRARRLRNHPRTIIGGRRRVRRREFYIGCVESGGHQQQRGAQQEPLISHNSILR